MIPSNHRWTLVSVFALSFLWLSSCDRVTKKPSTGRQLVGSRASAAVLVDAALPEVDAIGYEAELWLDDIQDTYRASLVGEFVATEDISKLSLDFEGNEVDNVQFRGQNASYTRNKSELAISFPTKIKKGASFSVAVQYHGKINPADSTKQGDLSDFGGLQSNRIHDEKTKIYSTLNWPSKARRWLPVRDHPRDGAKIAFTITAPRKYRIVATGKATGNSDNPDGTRTWQFKTMTPMPTYCFHFSAYDKWEVKQDASVLGLPIDYYYHNKSSAVLTDVYGIVPSALEFFEKNFGRYRWQSLSYIEEPVFGLSGMEHATAISMDPNIFGIISFARSAAVHELAHHWAGNLVRIRNWNDLWLSESFAEYLTFRFLTTQDGPYSESQLYRYSLLVAMTGDQQFGYAIRPLKPVTDPVKILSPIVYQKGALVLRLLEKIVGRQKFTRSLKEWFETNATKAVTTEDLKKAMSDSLGMDLTDFFNQFIYSEQFPILDVSFSLDGDETVVQVEQVQNKGPVDGFSLPLDLEFSGDSGEKKKIEMYVGGKVGKQSFKLGFVPSRACCRS